MPGDELMNMIPQSYEEAESLINKLQEDYKTEKSWFGDTKIEGEPNDKNEQNEKPQLEKKPKQEAFKIPDESEFEIDGQKFKFNQDDLKKYVTQGYKATQEYQKILQEKDVLSKEMAKLEANKSKYEHHQKIDDWARQNPELYNRLALEYENMNNGGNFGDVPPYLAKFVSELNSIKEKFSEIEEFKTHQRATAQDSALNTSISQFKQEHPQFDWNDKTLEQKILLHAANNNIPSFRAAARDLLFDDLVKRTEIKAKDALGKEIQRNTRLGEVQKRSAGTVNQNSKPINVNKMSWDQIAQQVKKAHGF